MIRPTTARASSTSATVAGGDSIDFVASDQVGGHVRHGAAWSAAHIIARNGINIGSTAILARVLSPDDYGLTSMVATLTALLLVFSDMGLGWATIQRKGLSRAQVNNLFWVNVAAGAALWVVCVCAAPTMAEFYGRSELVAVTTVLGAGFVISGLAVQPMALMTRAMNFRRIALVEIAGVIAGAVTAITVALAGGTYWALVAQALSSALARTIIALVLGRWRVAPPVRGVQTWSLVSFGGLMALNGLLIYLSRNLDTVLIGKVWGADALGLYGRAYFLMLLPSMIVNGVLTSLLVPALSAFQEDRLRLGSAYRRALSLVAYAGTPMAVGLGLTAGPAVQLVYGPKWLAVVPILAWLSIAAATQPIYNTSGWLFTATGRGRAYLVLTVVNVIILFTVFLWTVSQGAVALAQGYGLVMGLFIPLPALWFAHHAAGIPFWPSLKALAPIAVMNAAMALAVWGVGAALYAAETPWPAALSVQVGVGILIYLALTPVLLKGMTHDLLAMLLRRHAPPHRKTL